MNWSVHPNIVQKALHRNLTEVERDLRPAAKQIRAARDRAQSIVGLLHADNRRASMFQVDDLIAHGSLSRGVGLSAFRDIDYIVLFDSDSLLTLQGADRSAQDTVTRMARVIRERKAGVVAMGFVEVRAQNHSVGVSYPNSGYRIDLVPAKLEDGQIMIPCRFENEWIVTAPDRARQRLERAMQVSKDVGAAIRLLKGWNRARGKSIKLSSYAIELVLVKRATQRKSDLLELIGWFFDTVASADKRHRLSLVGEQTDNSHITVQDPDSKKNVMEGIDHDERKKIIEACRWTMDKLDDVLERLADDPEAGVQSALRQIFIGNW